MTRVDDPALAAARLMAGVPATNSTLYWRIRFLVGDPAALLELPDTELTSQSILILRDIEMNRARKHARADRVACPADFAPEAGLSGDRETATAQSVAECLRRHGIRRVIADRALPLLYANEVQKAGIAVECDPDWGVLERRSKDEQEIEWLREAQRTTEGAMRLACETVAHARARHDGVLLVGGQPLTSERLRAIVDVWLLEQGYTNPTSIIAGGPQAADCHDLGSGELRTEQPVIIDIFPRNRRTLYYGDCTRTVVHGQIPDVVQRMHAAVVAAKAAATASCRAGVTGEAVYDATGRAITAHGYALRPAGGEMPDEYCGMTHGTGHGIGLDVHEPPLLDTGGPELVVGDAVTIEPGLYDKRVGGIRVEDMVIVTREGCENLNQLPEGLQWA
jgi:Xaa-Pro aminopeptidase